MLAFVPVLELVCSLLAPDALLMNEAPEVGRTSLASLGPVQWGVRHKQASSRPSAVRGTSLVFEVESQEHRRLCARHRGRHPGGLRGRAGHLEPSSDVRVGHQLDLGELHDCGLGRRDGEQPRPGPRARHLPCGDVRSGWRGLLRGQPARRQGHLKFIDHHRPALQALPRGGAWGVLSLLGLLLLFLFCAAPSASASDAYPLPPAAWVIDLTSFNEFSSGASYQWQANFNTSMRLSADDPSQTTGTLSYYLYGARTDGSPAGGGAGCATPLFLQIDDSTCAGFLGVIVNGTGGSPGFAITGRAPWVWAGSGPGSYATSGFDDLNLTLYTATYNVTSSKVGGASCGLAVQWTDGRLVPAGMASSYPTTLLQTGHLECGTLNDPPAGVNGLVISQYANATCTDVGTAPCSTTNVSWALSPDDPNQTVGQFEYWTFSRSENQRPDASVYAGVRTTPVGQAYHLLNLSGGVGTSDPLYVEVVARDNLTHQRTNFSCTIFVQSGSLYSGGACGALGMPTGGASDGTPSFPGLDLPTLAPELGLTSETLGYIVGALTVLGTLLGGFAFAGKVGGFIGAVLGVGLAALLNLVGLWFVVVLFFAAALAVALKLRGGGGE